MSTPKRTKKPKPAVKPSDIMDLYRAAQRYIDSRGGKLLVVNGAGVLHNPHDTINFDLVIQCTGKKPVYAKP